MQSKTGFLTGSFMVCLFLTWFLSKTHWASPTTQGSTVYIIVTCVQPNGKSLFPQPACEGTDCIVYNHYAACVGEAVLLIFQSAYLM